MVKLNKFAIYLNTTATPERHFLSKLKKASQVFVCKVLENSVRFLLINNVRLKKINSDTF